MSKRLILNKHLKNNSDSFDRFYREDVESAMDEHAQQVAVAFAEWKDRDTQFVEEKSSVKLYVITHTMFSGKKYNNQNLYQYFIDNVYNK